LIDSFHNSTRLYITWCTVASFVAREKPQKCILCCILSKIVLLASQACILLLHKSFLNHKKSEKGNKSSNQIFLQVTGDSIDTTALIPPLIALNLSSSSFRLTLLTIILPLLFIWSCKHDKQNLAFSVPCFYRMLSGYVVFLPCFTTLVMFMFLSVLSFFSVLFLFL